MRVDIAWWELEESAQTIDSLRADLRDGAIDEWADVPGLRMKLWMSDRLGNRWGAIMVWDSDRPANGRLPGNRAAELIGRPSDERARFEVEVEVEGAHRRRVSPQPRPCFSGLRKGARTHEYTVVDAFARNPLEGNPVAVFLDAADLTAPLMQRVARELNLSETAFVLPPEREGDFRVRIFTPVNELPFAGHPLLGTAIALGTAHRRDHLRVETAMGLIPFELVDDDGVPKARMRQPVPSWGPYEHAEELLAALGVEASTTPVEVYRNGPRHVFVGLESVAALSALDPDHRALSRLPDIAANCFAGAGTHWRARMFSPAYGVVEDAATGSAAGPLAIHLARHGLAVYGQDHQILQGVEMGRPSFMQASAEGTAGDVSDVYVSGHGVVVAHGVLHL